MKNLIKALTSFFGFREEPPIEQKSKIASNTTKLTDVTKAGSTKIRKANAGVKKADTASANKDKPKKNEMPKGTVSTKRKPS
jgi:hypothetical protein